MVLEFLSLFGFLSWLTSPFRSAKGDRGLFSTNAFFRDFFECWEVLVFLLTLDGFLSFSLEVVVDRGREGVLDKHIESKCSSWLDCSSFSFRIVFVECIISLSLDKLSELFVKCKIGVPNSFSCWIFAQSSFPVSSSVLVSYKWWAVMGVRFISFDGDLGSPTTIPISSPSALDFSLL